MNNSEHTLEIDANASSNLPYIPPPSPMPPPSPTLQYFHASDSQISTLSSSNSNECDYATIVLSAPIRFRKFRSCHDGNFTGTDALERFSTVSHPTEIVYPEFTSRPSGFRFLPPDFYLAFKKRHPESAITEPPFYLDGLYILARHYSDVFHGAAAVFLMSSGFNFFGKKIKVGSRIILEGVNDFVWVYIVTRLRCRTGRQAYIEAVAFNVLNGAYSNEFSFTWPPIVICVPFHHIDMPYSLDMTLWERRTLGLASQEVSSAGIVVYFGNGSLRILPVQNDSRDMLVWLLDRLISLYWTISNLHA